MFLAAFEEKMKLNAVYKEFKWVSHRKPSFHDSFFIFFHYPSLFFDVLKII